MGVIWDKLGNYLKLNSDGSVPTTIVESLENQRGLAANKPAASSLNIGTTYWSVDTDPHADAVEVSNGTAWVVM